MLELLFIACAVVMGGAAALHGDWMLSLWALLAAMWAGFARSTGG